MKRINGKPGNSEDTPEGLRNKGLYPINVNSSMHS